MLLGRAELNTIEFLISKSLIDSYISHDEFFSVNNVLREYSEIKNPKTSLEYIIKNNGNLSRQLHENTANENSSVRKAKQNRLMLLSSCAVYGKKK